MEVCPRCKKEKLHFHTPSGQIFKAQKTSFREADDGATVFDDLCLGIEGKPWDDLLGDMIAQESDSTISAPLS